MKRDDYTAEQQGVRTCLARALRMAMSSPSAAGYDPESIAFGVWWAASRAGALRDNEFYGRRAIPFRLGHVLRARAERRRKEAA